MEITEAEEDVYELTLDEAGVRSLVQNIIDTYERGLVEAGSYEGAVKIAEDVTLNSLDDMADRQEAPDTFTRH